MKKDTLLQSELEPVSQPTKATLPALFLGAATVFGVYSPTFAADQPAPIRERDKKPPALTRFHVFDLGYSSRVDAGRDCWSISVDPSDDLISWDDDLTMEVARKKVSLRVNIIARGPRKARLDIDEA